MPSFCMFLDFHAFSIMTWSHSFPYSPGCFLLLSHTTTYSGRPSLLPDVFISHNINVIISLRDPLYWLSSLHMISSATSFHLKFNTSIILNRPNIVNNRIVRVCKLQGLFCKEIFKVHEGMYEFIVVHLEADKQASPYHPIQ